MVDVRVEGLDEAIAGMNAIGSGVSEALADGMRESTAYLTALAKANLVGYESPSVGGVDTGRLRASITPAVFSVGDAVQGVVGSNVEYSPFVEYDTRPHWPPLEALETWAARHGTTAFTVARAIARRGTIGKRFLERAAKDGADKVREFLAQAIGALIRR